MATQLGGMLGAPWNHLAASACSVWPASWLHQRCHVMVFGKVGQTQSGQRDLSEATCHLLLSPDTSGSVQAKEIPAAMVTRRASHPRCRIPSILCFLCMWPAYLRLSILVSTLRSGPRSGHTALVSLQRILWVWPASATRGRGADALGSGSGLLLTGDRPPSSGGQGRGSENSGRTAANGVALHMDMVERAAPERSHADRTWQ